MYSSNDRLLIDKLLKDFYVDGLVSDCSDFESGRQFYQTVKESHECG